MSYRLVRAVLLSTLKPNWRMTAVVMAEVAKHDGSSIFLSVEEIGRRVGKSRRAVQYNLHDLCRLGVLVVENGGKGGKSRTTRYHF